MRSFCPIFCGDVVANSLVLCFLKLYSKSLRKETPIKTYHDLTATEEQEITNDLEV